MRTIAIFLLLACSTLTIASVSSTDVTAKTSVVVEYETPQASAVEVFNFSAMKTYTLSAKAPELVAVPGVRYRASDLELSTLSGTSADPFVDTGTFESWQSLYRGKATQSENAKAWNDLPLDPGLSALGVA